MDLHARIADIATELFEQAEMGESPDGPGISVDAVSVAASILTAEIAPAVHAMQARLAEAERLLSNFLWYGDVRDKDMNDDAWKFLGFPPDPRLSGNGSGERNG
jgi:hypothetical protein